MNTTLLSTDDPVSPRKQLRRIARPQLILSLCAMLCAGVQSKAAVFTWDADPLTTGPQDGNGNWADASMWWDGAANQTWADGNEAVFGIGAGSPGDFVVTNNTALAQPVSMTFTNPGNYTITGDGVNAGQLAWTASGGGIGVSSKGLWVGTNISVRVDVPWRDVNGSDIFLGANSVLTFAQGTFGNQGGSVILKGSGPLVSTVNATNGTWGGPTGNLMTGTMLVAGSTFHISGAAVVNVGTRFDIGRSATGAPVSDGVITVSDGGQLNVNANNSTDANANLQISRGFPATVNIQPGGNINTLKNGGVSNGKVILIPDSGSRGVLNVSGGVLNVGTGINGYPGASSPSLTLITLMQGSMNYGVNASAIFNLSGGTITAQGIQIGSSGGTYTSNPTNQINITGGTLYLDVPNISLPKSTGTNYAFNVSGGTIAATANWSPACTAPINLTNINGDITLQASDVFGTPYNMAFAGALTGVGGLKKTGPGTLSLSGPNNYAGTTLVSDGTLSVSTANAPTNGPVVLEGGSVASGLPVCSVSVANVGQKWTVGNLTYNSGTPTADFNFGSFPPSPTVAPIQVDGNIAFSATPQVTIQGSVIAVGDYPLWHYTGTISGTVPTTPTSLPDGVAATIVNDTGTKSIVLHVTSSPVNPSLTWGVGSGVWDIDATANWLQSGSPSTYTDGKKVLFDDTASGPFPVTVTLDTTVNPSTIQVNTTNTYAISGSGNITGSAALQKFGSGTLTLSGTNTYTGGTTVSAGQLNINYGGDGIANSAIGTGPLTNAMGAQIDNTSGSSIVLATPIAQYWNDDFTFVGSSDLSLGPGMVTLGSGTVAVTVNAGTLEVPGQITDNGLNYGLAKAGAGALTLSNYNFFNGGMQLNAGTLNIDSDGAVGSGMFTINGGVIDTTAGVGLSLTSPIGLQWNGSFIFNGSSDLFLYSPISVLSDGMTVTVNANTLTTYGEIVGGNRSITKAGPGTLTIAGSFANSGIGFTINQGTVNLNKEFGANAVNANAITVNTNGNLVFLNPTWTQLGILASITLNGGDVELNGDTETFSSLTFNSGTLHNNALFTSSQLTMVNGLSLVGSNCTFQVGEGASIVISNVISGAGGFVKTGSGSLNLFATNIYTGGTWIAEGSILLTDPMGGDGGSIAGSSPIDIAAGATLDASGRLDQTVSLKSGQTLMGNGGVKGNLVALSGSTVSPGDGVGTLYVSNNITLGGNLLIELNRPNSDHLVSLSGAITPGGTLTVTNIGPALEVNDTFQIFPSGVNGFAYNLVTTDANGVTYQWQNDIATLGSIKVISVTTTVEQPTLESSFAGNNISFSWTGNFKLQSQTNSVGGGLINNPNAWFDYPDGGTSPVNITINPSNPTVFFRLVSQ